MNPPLYISNVEIQNIRCFERVAFDLQSESTTGKSLVLVGDNAVGKTSLLRCIAIGLCDRVGASGLLSDLYGNIIRSGANQGSITLTLSNGSHFITTVTKDDAGAEEVQKSFDPNTDFPWDDLFVCGYGANRSMPGGNHYEEYAIADAVYTLFNYEWKLQNPYTVILQRGRAKRDRDKEERRLCDILARVMMLNEGAVSIGRFGLEVDLNRREDASIDSISDGYRSTATWVLDLMGWSFLQYPNRSVPSGIVLIDEVEQHLHPRWQRHILNLLATLFPKIQFIVTTHSPLCAAGTADVSKGRFDLQLLKRDEDGHVNNSDIPSLSGLRADQVLTSEAFGLNETRNPSIGDKTERFYELLGKRTPTAQENSELATLRRQLTSSVPELGQFEAERKLRDELRELVKSLEEHSER